VFDGSPVENLSSGGGSTALIHRHKPQCLLCLCKRPVFLDFCCLAHQPVNMSCKSGWPRWVSRIVGSMIYPGISFSFDCLRSSLCATRRLVLQDGTFRCLQTPSVDNNRHVVLLPMRPHSVGVCCTHEVVGYQRLGFQCTSICQDLSRR